MDLQQSNLYQGLNDVTSNNVTRLLESRKVPFTAIELSAEKHSAVETAALLKVPPDLVYKTIVVLREKKGKPILAVVPGDRQVDMKLVAGAVGEKKVIIATEKEAERLTGLKVGGISALALLNRGFEILMDTSAESIDEFIVSGGMRGLMIRMRISDYLNITGARMASILPGGLP